jgi:3-hydroxyacyl-[acyl-carrier-protein] dehydratase
LEIPFNIVPVTPEDLGLPHRPPFLFLDAVTRLESGQSAEGVHTFPVDDPVFQGHFPGEPIVPGVLLTESIAQLAGIAAGQGVPEARFLLSGIRSMKFPSAAKPGETLKIEVTKKGELGPLLQFDGRVTIGDRVVAEGGIILSRR